MRVNSARPPPAVLAYILIILTAVTGRVLGLAREPFTASGNFTPLLNSQQLTMGYNGFLGLLPHEQIGSYIRRPIFKLHNDPDRSFVQLQASLTAVNKGQFATPLEYYITGESGSCSFDTSYTAEENVYESTDLSSISKMHGVTADGLNFVAGAMKEATMAETGGTVSATTELNLAIGNTRLNEESNSWASSGFTKKTQTYVKRIYYTAGLRLDAFVNESFTDEFKAAAFELGNGTYDFETTITFIHNWGNYVYDSAHMGAMAYSTTYYTGKTEDSTIQAIAEKSSNADVQILVDYKESKKTRKETQTVDGTNHTFVASAVTRIGEFATSEAGGSNIIGNCRIGNTISPQIVGFNLRSLSDEEIPLHLFMGETRAQNFRAYLRNATNEMLRLGQNCTDTDGTACSTARGICVTDLEKNNNGTYSFWCRKPEKAIADPDAVKESYDFNIWLFNWRENKDYVKTHMYRWPYPGAKEMFKEVHANTETIKLEPVVIKNVGSRPTRFRIDQTLYDPDCNSCYANNSVKCGGINEANPRYDRSRHTVGLSVVVCPILRNSINGDVLNGMCSRIFHAAHNGIVCATEARTLYSLDFYLDQYNPVPLNVTYTSGYARWIADNPGMVSGNIYGGSETTNSSKHRWPYPASEVDQDRRFGSNGPWVSLGSNNWRIRNPVEVDGSTGYPTPVPTGAPTSFLGTLCNAKSIPSREANVTNTVDTLNACFGNCTDAWCNTFAYNSETRECRLYDATIPVDMLFDNDTNYYGYYGCPTAPPTATPTQIPTSPTYSPTAGPSVAPSVS